MIVSLKPGTEARPAEWHLAAPAVLPCLSFYVPLVLKSGSPLSEIENELQIVERERVGVVSLGFKADVPTVVE